MLRRMAEEQDLSDTSEMARIVASDARIVEEVRQGNANAFGDLVRRYERRLLRVIGRFVADHETVRDLAQETFLQAFSRLAQFDASRRFGPWLFQIGVHLTIDHIRRQKRRRRHFWAMLFSDQKSDLEFDPAVADPRATLDVEQEVRQVMQALPEDLRIPLVLRDLENFSTSEIAAIVGRKEGTVRWRLALAREKFEEVWAARNGTRRASPSASIVSTTPAAASPVPEGNALVRDGNCESEGHARVE